MTGLKDLLVEEAGDARVYDVTDRAVRVVRRQRTMAALVPVAAALLVVAGLIGVGVPLGGGAGDQDSTPAAAGLPERLIPQTSPPVLPEDRGVGRAALAYLGGDGDQNGWVVVASDGSQYRVNGLRVDGISPDGRWLLVLRSDGSAVVRDLAGTGVHEFAGGVDTRTIARWSPDSRRLVVQSSDAATDAAVTYMVDLETGTRVTVPLDPMRPDRVCAVRNSGVLVLSPLPASSFSGLRLADSTNGQVIRDIPSANLGLRPTEAAPADLGMPLLGPDDRTLFISTHDTATPGGQTFLVGFDIDAGQLTERYALPGQLPTAERPLNGGVEYGQPDARYILGIHPDGPLLLHIAPSRNDPFAVGSVSIELVARDTGTLSTVTIASRPITLIRYPG